MCFKKKETLVLKVINNKNGVSMVEALVAGVLLAIASSGFLATVNVIYNLKFANNVNDSIRMQKEKIIGVLNSRNSWLNIIDNNSINCLKAGGSSCAAGTYEIAVYDGENNKITDITANNFGYNKNLNSCVYTDPDCDFRFLVSWSPVCESPTSCRSPLIKISGTLEVKTGLSKVVPSANLYSFNFIRGTFSSNALVNCNSLGGVYNTAMDKCALPSSNQICPQGQIVVGINSDGTIHCEALMNSECPPNTYAKGVNPDGSLLCFPMAGACTGNPPNGFNPDPNSGFSTGDGDGGGDCGDGGGDCGS